jgi:peroxiredoxin Q/BCP
MLKIGRRAPSFKLKDQDERTHTLKAQAGKWALVYFYPKDDTPGCTKEACAIAEMYDAFKRQGVAVFGVSSDSPRSHKKFVEKYHLPFTLLSDETMEVIEKYGAAVEKRVRGKLVRHTARVSYLINPEGNIAKTYPDVDPATHAPELLSDIKSLRKASHRARRIAPASP